MERGGDAGAVGLGAGRHRLALGPILAQQAVGILVRPPFPGGVGRREVEARGDQRFQQGTRVELGPVIDGNRPDRMGWAAMRRRARRLICAPVRWVSLPIATKPVFRGRLPASRPRRS